MSRPSLPEPSLNNTGYPDWQTGPCREILEAPPPRTSAPIPKDVELALVRGLIAERDPSHPQDDRILVRMTGGSCVAGLSIWLFAVYGVWSLLG